jgi:hypothetical protein
LSTYSGGVVINGGTLKFGANSTFNCGVSSASACSSSNTTPYSGPVGVGTVTINGGGTLDLNGNGSNFASYSTGLFYNPIVMSGTDTTALTQAILTNSTTSYNAGAYGQITLNPIAATTGTLTNVIVQPNGAAIILGELCRFTNWPG